MAAETDNSRLRTPIKMTPLVIDNALEIMLVNRVANAIIK
tara:strand:+ start:402 stop:521 length:120 start_codon:yes stop_codon:yes gene_type:complete